MGDRRLVRELQETIGIEVRRTPVFRDHHCHREGNTYTCALCELKRNSAVYPLAVLSILRHHGFFTEGWLPEESDLADILGHARMERMIAEQQRRLVGSITLTCLNCGHKTSLFNTFTSYVRTKGTSLQYRCNKCQFTQLTELEVTKKNRGKRKNKQELPVRKKRRNLQRPNAVLTREQQDVLTAQLTGQLGAEPATQQGHNIWPVATRRTPNNFTIGNEPQPETEGGE